MENKKKKIRLRSRKVFFTYPQIDDTISLDNVFEQLTNKCNAIDLQILNHIICKELHQDGNPHFHAWLELNREPDYVDPKYFDLIGYNAKRHHGNYNDQKYPDECAVYTTKGGTYITSFSDAELKSFVERAELNRSKRQRAKVTKDQIGSMLLSGTPLHEITLKFPEVLYVYKSLKENLFLFKQDNVKVTPLTSLNNHWVFGLTGVGKSKMVHDAHPDLYKKSPEVYWGGYNFQEVVLCEDVTGSTKYLEELLIWGDHYCFPAMVKHMDPITIRPKMIIVTSNKNIAETYADYFKRIGREYDEKMVAAIERRFKEIEVKEDVNPDPLNVFPDKYFLDIDPSIIEELSNGFDKINMN